jgi:hypothetical protein
MPSYIKYISTQSSLFTLTSIAGRVNGIEMTICSLPSAIDPQDGSWKVVIWCRAFNVDFGSAILKLQ